MSLLTWLSEQFAPPSRVRVLSKPTYSPAATTPPPLTHVQRSAARIADAAERTAEETARGIALITAAISAARPVVVVNVATERDLDTPGEPLPEGPEEPTTDPIIEEEPE